MDKAYIVLENGQVFEGEAFGARGETVGELVFTTSVVGYVETLTDPCYCGQIVLHTFPSLGNYGWIAEDMCDSGSVPRGVVLREGCDAPSNFRSGSALEDYLKSAGIVGIKSVDTRAITQIIRDAGVMNAMITTEKPEGVPAALRTYRVEKAVEATSPRVIECLAPEGEARNHVALLDYGAGKPLAQALLARGCRVTCLPYGTSAEAVLALAPDGIALSGGPGDPADNAACIAEIRALLGKKPIFGVGLGHQMLALAAGGRTEKLPYGHRGANQPVRDVESGRVYITEQNHGYAVCAENAEAFGARVRYQNLNDGSCEGLDYPALRAFSLQFSPDSLPSGSYERFLAMMGGEN